MRFLRHKTNIDFLGASRRRIALAISAIVVVVSLGSIITRGLAFGIDFTGGILLEVGYEQPADLGSIRQNLADAGFDDAQVQLFGSDTDVLVRLPPQDDTDPDELREQLRSTVAVGTSGVDLRRVEFVSPQVGSELTERGGLAMIIAMLLIFVYVMARFQWKFAAGAVAALAHDVIVTVGFFSIFQFAFDLTVVAAVLAVIGYSLNDTVVAFDRIRENFFKLRVHQRNAGANLDHRSHDLERAGRTVAARWRIDRAVFDRIDRRCRDRHLFVDLHRQCDSIAAWRQRPGLAGAG